MRHLPLRFFSILCCLNILSTLFHGVHIPNIVMYDEFYSGIKTNSKEPNCLIGHLEFI